MPIPTNPPLVPFGICPKCGGQLVERVSGLDGNQFIGCIKYPKCTYVERVEEEDAEVDNMNFLSGLYREDD